MKPSELITKIENNEFDSELKKLYVSDSAVNAQKPRYIRTINEFIKLFGDDRDVFVLSAPGRTEVCGLHFALITECVSTRVPLILFFLPKAELRFSHMFPTHLFCHLHQFGG